MERQPRSHLEPYLRNVWKISEDLEDFGKSLEIHGKSCEIRIVMIAVGKFSHSLQHFGLKTWSFVVLGHYCFQRTPNMIWMGIPLVGTLKSPGRRHSKLCNTSSTAYHPYVKKRWYYGMNADKMLAQQTKPQT